MALIGSHLTRRVRFGLEAPSKTRGMVLLPICQPGTNVSSLCLWEDDHRLGPAHAKKSEVRSLGRGRYASTGRQILFSSSDNSDIRFNGRAYRLRSEDAAQRFDEIILKPELVNREIGYCYIAHLELGAGSQRFAVWENESRLGPGYCLHDEIRTRGMGRYSIWGPAHLLFERRTIAIRHTMVEPMSCAEIEKSRRPTNRIPVGRASQLIELCVTCLVRLFLGMISYPGAWCT